jgi:GH35 family endo-1,4-beta-xylanase
VRPLPFDVNFQPKAAYYAIAETLQSAPHRG